MAPTALQAGIREESSSSNTFWNQRWRFPGLKADQHFEESQDIGNKFCFAWVYKKFYWRKLIQAEKK